MWAYSKELRNSPGAIKSLGKLCILDGTIDLRFWSTRDLQQEVIGSSLLSPQKTDKVKAMSGTHPQELLNPPIALVTLEAAWYVDHTSTIRANGSLFPLPCPQNCWTEMIWRWLPPWSSFCWASARVKHCPSHQTSAHHRLGVSLTHQALSPRQS